MAAGPAPGVFTARRGLSPCTSGVQVGWIRCYWRLVFLSAVLVQEDSLASLRVIDISSNESRLTAGHIRLMSFSPPR